MNYKKLVEDENGIRFGSEEDRRSTDRTESERINRNMPENYRDYEPERNDSSGGVQGNDAISDEDGMKWLLSGSQEGKSFLPEHKALVEAVSERVLDKLKPWFNRIYQDQARGVLIGTREINTYLGVSPLNFAHVGKLVKERRFPATKMATKSHQNAWVISKVMIDRWLFERHQVMTKAKELGIVKYRHGRAIYLCVDKLTEEEYDRCIREITKDRVKAGMYA